MGQCLGRYAKQCLPNYQVFDERRYFSKGTDACLVELKGRQIGLTICEDIWHQGPAEQSVEAGAELILNLNASPFHIGKQSERYQVLSDHAARLGVPVVYVNQVGGQDELVFDGASFAVNADGGVALQLSAYDEVCGDLRWELDSRLSALSETVVAHSEPMASLYNALVVGVRDYVNKNR